MPICEKKPSSWEEVKNGDFYIINGQHTWAAAKELVAHPQLSEERKKVLKNWKCNFIWSKDEVEVMALSERINHTNSLQWNFPDIVLYLQHARKIWDLAGRPQPVVVGQRALREGDAGAVAWKVPIVPLPHAKFLSKLLGVTFRSLLLIDNGISNIFDDNV